MKRMKPLVYAQRCGVSKETVYLWIANGTLPKGATWTKTETGRYVIHVDPEQHPPMPLYTDA